MNTRHLTGILAVGAAASLALAGCSSSTDEGSSADGGESMGTITLGYLPAWTDGLSTAFLLQDQLEKIGYTVEMQELTEAGPLYAGLAQGDVDIYPSAWPELTHASYMEEYGDDIEDLGTYYDNAKLTLAVPTYTNIDSIADLAGNADMFDGQIVGIEPGAGLTAQTQDSAMPAYDLDGEYELLTSSTAAMLTELETAIDNEEDIVVTLWRPFWANDAFDIKDLEDPEGAMGDPEGLHFLATAGFAEEFPEAAELIGGIELDDAEYGSLEDTVVNEYADEDDKSAAIDEWLEANPEAFDTIVAE
ncbi:glycine betaine ABC transporter substrate-binding protein [Microbacterium excoecariae]|uniref:glycine betaine ABC transporter substrate-binding protein n=1 Tax=Microbacterium excoecariae TaxID=2715210 RepID=UPI00140AEC1E|nr:glycine betaine ABC transporter substrate-binding protein [Microbacterium excoecariae]NHI16939.1 glycine betaine ABC transporter substrate-binding protein [Microbacterium excoecariae]